MQTSCDIIPGDCVGEIVLGAPLIVVTQALNENRDLYGVIHVSDGSGSGSRGVQQQPGGSVVLRSDRRKMSYHFHAVTQTLERIVVEDLCATELVYRSSVLSGPSRSTTFAHVYDVLGPTFQGSMNTETGVYRLKYPGVEVDFPIPSKYHQEFMSRGTHPTKLPDGSIPVASSVTILSTPGSDPNANRDVPYAKGKVLAGDHAVFDWASKVLIFTRSQVRIAFGDTPHQVMLGLGCSPRKIYNLVDNRMGIHSSAGGGPSRPSLESRLPMYCFNYPLLGIDFIFNGTHTLEKMMLHNPLPWHDTFLKYQRCNFTIKGPWTLNPLSTDMSKMEHTLDNGYVWREDDDVYAEERGVRPLISSTHCSNGLVLKIYAFSGIVLYVMPSLQRVVKVLLFEKTTPVGGALRAALTTAAAQHPPMERTQGIELRSPPPPPLTAQMATASSIDPLLEDGDQASPIERPKTGLPAKSPQSPPTKLKRLHVDPTEGEHHQHHPSPPPPSPPFVACDSSALESGSGSPSLGVRDNTAAYSRDYFEAVEDEKADLEEEEQAEPEEAEPEEAEPEEAEEQAEPEEEEPEEAEPEEAEEQAEPEEAEEQAEPEEVEEEQAEPEEAEEQAEPEQEEQADLDEEEDHTEETRRVSTAWGKPDQAQVVSSDKQSSAEATVLPSLEDAFSVPPPMPKLVGHQPGDEDHYSDDFEESSTRHFSARSSWTPSAQRTSTVPAATAAAPSGDEISDEHWGPDLNEQTDPASEVSPAGEPANAESEEGAETSETPPQQDGRESTLSPANRSGTSSTSNSSKSKKKKNNHRRR